MRNPTGERPCGQTGAPLHHLLAPAQAIVPQSYYRWFYYWQGFHSRNPHAYWNFRYSNPRIGVYPTLRTQLKLCSSQVRSNFWGTRRQCAAAYNLPVHQNACCRPNKWNFQFTSRNQKWCFYTFKVFWDPGKPALGNFPDSVQVPVSAILPIIICIAKRSLDNLLFVQTVKIIFPKLWLGIHQWIVAPLVPVKLCWPSLRFGCAPHSTLSLKAPLGVLLLLQFKSNQPNSLSSHSACGTNVYLMNPQPIIFHDSSMTDSDFSKRARNNTFLVVLHLANLEKSPAKNRKPNEN